PYCDSPINCLTIIQMRRLSLSCDRPMVKAHPCWWCWENDPDSDLIKIPARYYYLTGVWEGCLPLYLTQSCMPCCNNTLSKSPSVSVLTETACSFTGGVETGNCLTGIIKNLAIAVDAQAGPGVMDHRR